MTAFRANSRLRVGILTGIFGVLAGAALAQTSAPASPPVDFSRDASFLPPVATSAPVVITAPISSAVPAAAATPVTAPAAAPVVIQAPVAAAPAAAAVTPAMVSPPAAASPAVAPPVSIAKPVEVATIPGVDPESAGLLANAEGGLGADLWKSTPRALVVKLLAALNLPTSSKTLNNLAQRLLLTTAAAPEGGSDVGQSLISMRIEKTLALGDAANGGARESPGTREISARRAPRQTDEAALVSSQRDDVCARLPEIVKSHNGAEWQKLTLVCQLRASDTKAAQVTLDLLHAQGVRDDTFFFVAEKNVMAANKQLPRQLTPLKPLTLALLRLTDLPLPGEIYVHPDAALVPELLAAKAREDAARLGLAERSAERGLISGADLAAIYRQSVFTPDVLANAAISSESGPRMHALIFQAALQDKNVQNRLTDAAKFAQSVSPALLNAAGGPILLEMIGDVQPTAENAAASSLIARANMLAGKNDAAMAWLKLARRAASAAPYIAADLDGFWPQTVFSGLESESDFASDLSRWTDSYVKDADPKADPRVRRDQAASILLLLEADGFSVPNEVWVKVLDSAANEKRVSPSPLFLERLRNNAASPRHGETVLLALDLAGNGADVPLLSAIEIIHALRLAGLSGDAGLLAREQASLILAPAK